jgi:thiamine-phosphate pyrophosphorylase
MPLVLPRLYVIWEASLLPWGVMDCAHMLAESGVHLVQYRDKNASPRELLRVSRGLADHFRAAGISFIINDRPDVAVLAGASGVHVGQEDLGVEDARAVVGPDRWVAVSTHNVEQVRLAAETSADYIAVGPVFPTKTKAKADPVVGLELVRRARELTQKPLVAIGGITMEHARDVLDAGANSLAVASDIWRARDPRQRIRQYQEILAAGAGACGNSS